MKIVELGTKESESIISELKREIPVILVGSTISSWAPTSLFSGFDFTRKMLDLLFPISFLNSRKEEFPIIKNSLIQFLLNTCWKDILIVRS